MDKKVAFTNLPLEKNLISCEGCPPSLSFIQFHHSGYKHKQVAFSLILETLEEKTRPQLGEKICRVTETERMRGLGDVRRQARDEDTKELDSF